VQKSLVLLKPDAVQRGLVGELIGRLELKGLKLVALKLVRLDQKLAEEHYAEHVGKDYFTGLVEFITSGPVVAMVLEGQDAVTMVRSIMGATHPKDAAPGTVRGDLAVSIGLNLIHGSDSEESAAREIGLFFTPEEILRYDREIERWITES
jgi:nucleoside-diphosphate kinase